MRKITLLLTLAFMSTLISPFAFADEGMWTFNGFPSARVQKKYGVNIGKDWLNHVQLSSARLARGCSGSFVSPNGLVMTNHHCAHSCIEQLSTPKKDFVADGFYAKTAEDEVKCPDIEVNRLTDIADVTAQINKATEGKSGQAFNDAQKAEMSKIEKDCAAGSDGTRCDVVTLYHGGKYNLYKYKRYQDVRLVMAPEFGIAFFGGDPDNFNYPRYDIDMAFLRVYENGKPLQDDQYLRWSTVNAKEGDLTFVTGHPGRTSRLLTIAQLEFARDTQLIFNMLNLSELRGMLHEFSNRGTEQKRIADPDLFYVENSLKAFKGRLAALQDKEFFGKKVAAEKALRQKVNANPKWKKAYGSSWDQVAKTLEAYKKMYKSYALVEANHHFGSELFGIAKDLVRGSEEMTKPNEKRLREYADSALPALKQELFSTAPIHEDLEIAMMTHYLTKMQEGLTPSNPIVKTILGKKSPSEIAQAVIKGSHLKDVAYRKALFDGGKKAIESSDDPMIQFARLVEPSAREIREKYENEIEPTMKKEGERIAKAQFAVYGSDTYPDATFTLRVSYGQIKGYKEDDGQHVNPLTTFGGAYTHATGSDPFALPERWLKAKSQLDMSTPMDMATTNDIIGGNSGSPMINKNAEVVGLIFDGNIQSLGGEYGFDESQNRAVGVHSAAILEALDKVYGAKRVVTEIKNGEKKADPGLSMR